jgi:hypothetical protein
MGSAVTLLGAWDLAAKMSGSQAALEVYLQWIEQKTRDMLTNPACWHAVEAVKTALLERDTLRGEDVLRLVAEQQPGQDFQWPPSYPEYA